MKNEFEVKAFCKGGNKDRYSKLRNATKKKIQKRLEIKESKYGKLHKED